MDGENKPNLNFMSPNNSTDEEILALVSERFTYKQWVPEQVVSGEAVTDAAIEFGIVIVKHVPPSPTRTRALNLIEEARMLANAAITHNGKF